MPLRPEIWAQSCTPKPSARAFWRVVGLAVFLILPLGAAQPYRVVAFGDSHTVVEAGMGSSLANRLGRRVDYTPLGINGTTGDPPDPLKGVGFQARIFGLP